LDFSNSKLFRKRKTRKKPTKPMKQQAIEEKTKTKSRKRKTS
jgi:hypothetical protein